MQMHLFNEYEGQLEQKQKELEETKANKDEEIKSLKSQIQAKAAVKARLASVKTQAVSAPAPVAVKYAVGCELYRPLLAQYNWPTEAAMLVMTKESGCNPNAVGPTNDHGLFQLNNQPVYNPAANIAIAYGKYVGGRVGANNWSAWYAVCTPGNNPQPKFAGIHCQ